MVYIGFIFVFSKCFGEGQYTNMCSQYLPIIQNIYFKFDWLIYKLFVPNMGKKLDSLQMMIFLYVCPTCSVVELKTPLETWIERNDVNAVYLYRFFI
jgi:hypothetical protein